MSNFGRCSADCPDATAGRRAANAMTAKVRMISNLRWDVLDNRRCRPVKSLRSLYEFCQKTYTRDMKSLLERKEWKFFVVLLKADRWLAVIWNAILILRG